MIKQPIAALAVSLALAAPAHATQVCAWMVETVKADDLHEVAVYVQADRELEVLYQAGGPGMTDRSGRSNSPGSGTYTLHPGQAAQPWGFGSTLSAPAKIDISFSLHVAPADIFDKTPTPVLAAFVFRRDIPSGETTPPATLAKKQCAEVKS